MQECRYISEAGRTQNCKSSALDSRHAFITAKRANFWHTGILMRKTNIGMYNVIISNNIMVVKVF